MSLTRCVENLKSHLQYVRSLPPADSHKSKALRGRLIQQSYQNFARNFTSTMIFNAYKKLTEEEKPHLYLTTLTFDPKRGTPNIASALKYLNSRLETSDFKKCEIIFYAYVQEPHKSGVPHFHIVMQSKKTIPMSHWRDWPRKHGNLKYWKSNKSKIHSKSKTGNLHTALKYITKDQKINVLKTHKQAELFLTQLCPRNTSENPEN